MLDDLFATLQAPLPRTVTQSALSQARQKLKASVFEALNERLLGSLAALLPEPRWRGLRRVAADSTTLRLPAWPENQAEFGVQSDHPGQPYVLARALGLFATTSRLMLKAVLGRFDEAERALLVQLLPHLAGDDLLILDRGFPAVWLFTLLQQRGLPFLARMDGTQWSCVERFLLSGQTETVVTLEESFKVLKHRLNVEQFSGELPEAIRQDFHAKLFTANLAEALARSAYDTLPEDKAQRYDPNVTYVLNSLKTRLFCWLIQRVSPSQILTLIELYARTLELKRPDRKAPRPQSRIKPKPRRQYK